MKSAEPTSRNGVAYQYMVISAGFSEERWIKTVCRVGSHDQETTFHRTSSIDDIEESGKCDTTLGFLDHAFPNAPLAIRRKDQQMDILIVS